jgi:hypothetical protein
MNKSTPIKSKFNFFFKGFLMGLFIYFFWLMLKLTSEYFSLEPDVSFLMIKQTEVTTHPEYLYFFYTHVFSSIFVLAFGFIAILRKNFGIKNLHQLTGKIYVFLILILAAPSGIYMGFLANGGVLAKSSFIILGISWFISTFLAFKLALKKKFKDHKKWMWRSFAFTLSAITLRMWKVIIIQFVDIPPMELYNIIAWLGWIPNILIVEYLIFKKHL